MAIFAYFGGLRLSEVTQLEMEKITACKEGLEVTHKRAKQRSDKRDSKFIIPGRKTRTGFNFAKVVDNYLNNIKAELGVYTGRVFWTGRGNNYVKTPMGRNMIAAIPHQIAQFLNKNNAQAFTFHSFRRSSASAAADQGATSAQLVDFYGWKSTSMANQYITTSKAMMDGMANKLIGDEEGQMQPAKVANHRPGAEQEPGADQELGDKLADSGPEDETGKERQGKNRTADKAKDESETSDSSASPVPDVRAKKKGHTTIVIKNVHTFKM